MKSKIIDLVSLPVGSVVTLSGWIHRRRNHGDLFFIDLRDYTGIIQCRSDSNPEILVSLSKLRCESVITVSGKIKSRPDGTENKKILTGSIDIDIENLIILNSSEVLPFEVNGDDVFRVSEEIRLEYRFLDLRRAEMAKNLKLRSSVISYLRRSMEALDFMEIQTPILTASSPEGARDYLVPARLHPGKFYALPQAPQIFKQTLMSSGIERYFQIAPCFRDEASRSDRLPGEFYQLDYEMAFATQADVFKVGEDVLYPLFTKFAEKPVSQTPWIQIPYDTSIEKYGNDKPDLRYTLEMQDVTALFKTIECPPFMQEILDKGGVIKTITVPHGERLTPKFGKELDSFAKDLGMPGIGFMRIGDIGTLNPGPLAKFFTDDAKQKITNITLSSQTAASSTQVIFFIAGMREEVKKYGSRILFFELPLLINL